MTKISSSRFCAAVFALCVLVTGLYGSGQEHGRIITFDAPGAGTGYYIDANDVYHGFLRGNDGRLITFNAPKADLTPDSYNGTLAVSINAVGTITGYYIDGNDVYHGFMRTP